MCLLFAGFVVRAEHYGFFVLLFSSDGQRFQTIHMSVESSSKRFLQATGRNVYVGYSGRVCWGKGFLGDVVSWSFSEWAHFMLIFTVFQRKSEVYHEMFEFWTTWQLELGFCESLTLPFHGVECVATALEYMQLVVASIHHSPPLNPTTKAGNFHVKLRLRQPRFWNSSPASYPS